MEQNPVIIDNGTTLLKAGFAGDDMPCAVISTVPAKHGGRSFKTQQDYTSEEWNELDDWTKDLISKRRGYNISRGPIERGEITDWDAMERMWHLLFYTELRVSPETQPLLITESLRNSKSHREKITQSMFETFSVPSLVVANPSLLALIASGRGDGLVIDAGGATTSIVPVHQFAVVENATSSLELGGQDLTDYCLKVLAERGVEFPAESARDHARNIKEQYGYVALNFEEEKTKQIQHPSYEHDKSVALGQELFQTPELYFKPDMVGLESMGLPKLVMDSISKCDPAIQSQLYGNILLAGGSSLFKNFEERLTLELSALMPSSQIKVIAPPQRVVNAWQGGSIIATMDSFKKFSTLKSEYDEVGPAAIHLKSINLNL